MSILGPLIPLFQTSGNVSSGFKTRVDLALFCTWNQADVMHTVCFIKFTSGAPLPVYMASIVTESLSPHASFT